MEKVLINGQYKDAHEGIQIMNPTTGKVAGVVPALSREDIDYAFDSAQKASSNWSATPLLNRIAFLERIAQLFEHYADDIAVTLANEIAKSLKDAKTEVIRTVEYIRYSNEEAKRIYPEAQTGEGMGAKNKLAIFRRVPLGVVLAISPFNYPINLAMAKIAPALVMGNTVVFKAATQGSLAGCWISRIMKEAELPAGVFNQVTGRGRDIGDILVTHENIDMISFTGGEKVGKGISMKSHMVPVVLELGGKDSAIVCDDADLNLTAKEILKGAFSYSGQRCTAIKRVFVTEKNALPLINLIKEGMSKLTVGTPYDNAVITPLIDMGSADFVQSLIDDAIKHGAEVVYGNKRDKNLLWPTLVDHVTEDMRLAWEEPFGPVLPIIRVRDVDEAIRLSNHSDYGLQGSVFTQNIDKAMKVSEQLHTGTVNVNRSSSRGPDSFPFVGIKASGLGVQGIKESLLSMTRFKGTIINW